MSPSYVSHPTASSATRSPHVQVGRMKIPTPGGHAFILRRLDTNAISLTTMFRATYPQASEDAEKAEINWIKNNYELSGANKTGRARFAGTWASIDVALNIADTYSISHLLPVLINAVPDPAQIYSKSRGKSVTQPLTPQPTPPSPPKPTGPNKRRKEGTPQPTTRASPAPVPTPAPAPVKVTSPVSTPRRSTRLKSPAPAPATVLLPLSPRRTPKLQRPRVEPEESQVPATPATPEVTHTEEEEAVVATEPNMAEDIQEQRELIAGLKAQRAAAVARGEEQTETAPSLKRTIEEVEPPLLFDPKEPEVEPRAVATNSRIRFLRNPSPQTKSVFWGVAAFAAGVGAV
jgi:hypothetical protein